MAITLLGSTQIISGGTGANSANMTAPAGLDDEALDTVLWGIGNTNSNSAISIGNDGGAYTVPFNASAITGASVRAGGAFGYKVGAASPGSTTVSWTADPRYHMGIRAAWSGVDLASPIDAQSGSVSTIEIASGVANPQITIPGITTITAGAEVLCGIAAGFLSDDNPAGFSAVSGWTKMIAGNAYWGTNTVSLALFRKSMPTAGAVGNLVTALSATTNLDTAAIGFMIALRPAAGDPAPSIVRPRGGFIL